VTKLGTKQLKNWDLIAFIGYTFSLFYSTEMNYKAHPASHPKGTRDSLTGQIKLSPFSKEVRITW
jgi:hypothetical protein